MAFRNFDNLNVYFDRENNPLHGKLLFCLQGTTTPAPVFAFNRQTQNYTPIQNPVFTNANGATERQVFLDGETNYTVYFYKYIGSGNMAEDEDVRNWGTPIYSVDSINPTTPSKIDDIQSELAASTLAGLRDTSTSVLSDGQTMILNGYHTAGDAPLAVYVWDPTSTLSDNGGSVIKPNDTSVGRWIMVLQHDYIDIRHFGCFGGANYYVANELASEFAHAVNYANTKGVDVLITNGFYKFVGGNYRINSSLRVTDGAYFMGKIGTTTNLTAEKIVGKSGSLFRTDPDASEELGNYGVLNIKCDECYSGWLNSGAKTVTFNCNTYRVNSTAQFHYIENAKVVFETANQGNQQLRLTNCIVESAGKINCSIIATNCHLTRAMFGDDYGWGELYLSGCPINLREWESADLYIRIKNKQNERDYGDLGEQELHGARLMSGAIVENCFGSATVEGGNYEFHNASLNLTVSGTPNFNAVDSWFTFNTNCTFIDFQLRRGSIAGSATQIQIVSNALLQDAAVNVPLNLMGCTNKIERCDINAQITATEPNILNCNVNANIIQYFTATNIKFNISNNVFENNCFHVLQRAAGSNVTNALVNGGVWFNNYSKNTTNSPITNDTHFVAIDRTGLDPEDDHHNYTHKQNTGVPKNAGYGANYCLEDITFSKNTVQMESHTEGTSANAMVFYVATNCGLMVGSHGHPLTFRMFSVGSTGVQAKIKISVYTPTIEGDTSWYGIDALCPDRSFLFTTSVMTYGSTQFAQMVPNTSSASIYAWRIGWGPLQVSTRNCAWFNVATSPTKISRVTDFAREYATTFLLEVHKVFTHN